MAKNKFFGRCYPTRPELPHSTVLEDTEDGGGYYHWSSPGGGTGGYRRWWGGGREGVPDIFQVKENSYHVDKLRVKSKKKLILFFK